MGYIITFGEKYWPANRIPFLIDSDDFPVSTPDRKDVEDAIGVWNKTEKVRLVPRNDEHDYVIFKRKKSTCNSNVGRKGGEQAILCNIGEGFKLGNIIHEIGHTLGLFHEHQRPDRDKYVSIDSSVKDDDNYYIETNGRAINNYDCDSIMHYPKIKDKITNLSSECEKMGQRIKPSMGDIAAASWLLSYPWAPFCGIGIKPNGDGYWLVEGKGGVLYYGNTLFYGSMGGQQLNQPICGMVVTQSGKGYWLVAEDGGVFTFGDAPFYGSMGDKPLNQPVCGMVATPSGKGYWLVAKDSGVFTFGDATYWGNMVGKKLNAPICGMAATLSGEGYWLVAEDGGVFTFGDAPFYGSMGDKPLNQPVCGMVATPSGKGYWLVARDGGVFTFGDAPFYGSMGDKPLNQPVCGMVATPSGKGYWLVAEDGGVFTFGDASFYGSGVG